MPPRVKIASVLLTAALCVAAVGARGQTTWSVVQTPPIDANAVTLRATTGVHKGTGGVETLAIICYGGRIEISVDGPAVRRPAPAYALSYRINGGPARELGMGTRGHLHGMALPGDAKRLLQSLPETGDITIRLAARTGAPHDATFRLDGIGAVRDKVLGCAR